SSSASWFQWALFSGHLFFGAGSSENCLNQFSCKREVRGGWLNQQFDLRFLSFDYQISKSDFQNYESFRFSTFWLLFVNQSRVNLVSRKTQPIEA
ncbi:hypothetical protein ACH7VL_004417, partial [Vibrio vulnificus]